MVIGRSFIYLICIPSGKDVSFVQRQQSSVKFMVKYQGHIFKKNVAIDGVH